MDGHVPDDADVGHGIIDGVGGFGFVEVGCEGWGVGCGKSVVWGDRDVQFASAYGVAVDACVVKVVDDVEEIDGGIAVHGGDDGEESISGGIAAVG